MGLCGYNRSFLNPHPTRSRASQADTTLAARSPDHGSCRARSVLTVGGILRDVVGGQQRKCRVERVILGAVVNDVILTADDEQHVIMVYVYCVTSSTWDIPCQIDH